ncbi:winged helix-turn-helix transcriptional regulator [Lactobacillus salsicarnum]|uniref:Winged helix-turn-helix transcriptional regulator n=2 Tax=Companilactobacillus mishanensis TaxID=2486008 RepID=A0A5P0ZFU9_9LACO|nr:winged helix-turn-helix transcriptional regulator [Companilactobacillus mishanensis]
MEGIMKQSDIDKIRQFDRFYTNVLKLTDKYHLHTHYTLLEARILLEINAGTNTANQLLTLLKLDKGYLSRVLKKLENDKLISKEVDPNDLRIKKLILTNDGHAALNVINSRADSQIEGLFANVPSEDINNIIKSMEEIQNKLKE